MKTHAKRLAALLTTSIAVTGTVAYGTPAAAQVYAGGNSGVANVSVASGNVYIVRGDSGQQVGAAINAPLVPGDYLATGSGSQAEAQFDGASMLRLASNTQIRFVNLRPGSREVQLAAGTVGLAEEQGGGGGEQIDTPSLTVRPTQSGDYRVSVLGNGQTRVTVRSGAATIATANGSESLGPGSTLVADGSGVGLQNPIGFDSFDQFNISRDQAVVSSYNANPYVSPQLAGYSNFAQYGRWQNVPGYGEAWAPNNQSQNNFAPYQNGQWVWEPGSGYTWVDNSPTGYATSHYGSWFNNQNHGGWLWQPPATQYQNSSSSLASAWLPAAVSFFLSGNNGNSGAGLGSILGSGAGGAGGLLGSLSGLFGSGNADNSNTNIGWIPLAPGEQYQPWYGQNNSYPATSVSSVPNVTNIYNYYSNARYNRAVTMIPVSAWRRGNFKSRVSVPTQQLRQVVLIRGAVPIVPTTANLRYTPVVKAAHPIVLSRTFTAPRLAARAPAVTHIAFKAQQAQIQSIAGVRPKVVQLAPRKVALAPPAYRPVVRPPVRLAVIKPVAPVMPHIAHLMAPGARPIRTATPIVKAVPHAAPVQHSKTTLATPVSGATHPVTQPKAAIARPIHTTAPLLKPALHVPAPVVIKHAAPVHTIAPAIHTVAPVVKPVAAPVVHTVAPVLKPVTAPVVHTVAPVVKPVTAPVVHTVAPVVKPVTAPVVHTVAPVVKPVTAPVVHTVAPVVKPVTAPPVAPAVKPLPRETAPAAAPVHTVAPPTVKSEKKPAEPAIKPSTPAG